MIQSLHHIAILCSNREKALAFYETLGFRLEKNYVRPERNDEILMLCGHGMTLELFITTGCPARPTNPEAYGLRHLALRVERIEELIQKLQRAGYVPEALREDTFDGQKMTFVKDPDGLPIELHE